MGPIHKPVPAPAKGAPHADFARRLAVAMRRANVSRRDIQRELDVTYEMARRYTLGTAKPRPEHLAQLATLLGIQPAELEYGILDVLLHDTNGQPTAWAALRAPQQPQPFFEVMPLLPSDTALAPTLMLARVWIRTALPALSSPLALRFTLAAGDDMAPTIAAGAVALVDTGQASVRAGGVFVFDGPDRALVRRFQPRLDGTVLALADNPALQSGTLDANALEKVHALGRVLCAFNPTSL